MYLRDLIFLYINFLLFLFSLLLFFYFLMYFSPCSLLFSFSHFSLLFSFSRSIVSCRPLSLLINPTFLFYFSSRSFSSVSVQFIFTPRALLQYLFLYIYPSSTRSRRYQNLLKYLGRLVSYFKAYYFYLVHRSFLRFLFIFFLMESKMRTSKDRKKNDKNIYRFESIYICLLRRCSKTVSIFSKLSLDSSLITAIGQLVPCILLTLTNPPH